MPQERPPLPEVLETLARRLSDAVAGLLPPSGAADARARLDSAIEAVLARLDLVPREEYERQVAALHRLEETLATLEARLAALEGTAHDRTRAGRDTSG